MIRDFVIHWSIRERHHNDLTKICQSLGFMNDKKQMVKFDGKVFEAKLAETGEHDAMLVGNCKCNQEKK